MEWWGNGEVRRHCKWNFSSKERRRDGVVRQRGMNERSDHKCNAWNSGGRNLWPLTVSYKGNKKDRAQTRASVVYMGEMHLCTSGWKRRTSEVHVLVELIVSALPMGMVDSRTAHRLRTWRCTFFVFVCGKVWVGGSPVIHIALWH